MSNNHQRIDWATDLFLPTLLFAAVGGMGWAVRGCSGFGGENGCVFAGVLWGAAWWFIARNSGEGAARRYTSGWIILALTVGIGLSGGRGWMQWPSFFNGHLQTNYSKGEWVPISRTYGFIWLFIAGVPWAGIGACLLAWCGSNRPMRAWQWVVRLACGFGGSYLALFFFNHFPDVFLPLYKTMKAQYMDAQANPNLRRLINDNRAALRHLGFYAGFLLFEVGRRDWKNVLLILTVGLVNGLGWAACQNWQWAARVWPEGQFNFWRCWETSGGISMGIAYGLAYFLVNRPMSPNSVSENCRSRGNEALIPTKKPEDQTESEPRYLGSYNGQVTFEWLLVYVLLALAAALFFVPVLHGIWGIIYFALTIAFGFFYLFRHRQDGAALSREDPNLDRLGAYLGLLLGLGMSIRNGLKGWFNIYRGNENYWSEVLWRIAGPVMLVCLVVILWKLLFRPLPRNFSGDTFPHAYRLIWLVLIVQNSIAQLITGPHSSWPQTAFSVYYLLLFFISAVIIYHFQRRNRSNLKDASAPAGIRFLPDLTPRTQRTQRLGEAEKGLSP